MDNTFWLKQGSEPLFGDLEWNKPERRDHAGKICIIGGSRHDLGAPSKAFDVVRASGPSDLRIVLPDKTKPLVSGIMPEALFLPSTASGEFSNEGEIEILDHSTWADTILFPGDSGHNSQTAMLFEAILRSYKDQIILTRDAVDILDNDPAQLFNRPRTTLIISFAQLQKLLKGYRPELGIVFSMDLIKLVDILHTLTQGSGSNIVTTHQNQIIVASGGKVSTTKLTNSLDEPKHWRLRAASLAACYQTWYPTSPFKALTQVSFLIKSVL